MLITREAIVRPRTREEFFAWVLSVMELGRDNPEERAELRLAAGPAKVFRDEVLPFYVFASSHLADPDSTIHFPNDNGPADAIFDHEGRQIGVQIVQAVDGYDDRLRMEALTRNGSVPGSGPIRRVKSKSGESEIVASSEAMNRRDRILRSKKYVSDAIAKKKAKPYPVGTWLLVAFEDHPMFSDAERESVRATAQLELEDSRFERAFLIGRVGPNYCGVLK